MAGIPLREIPYNGAGPGLTAVLAGQVALVFGNALTVQPTSRAEGCAHSASPAPNVQPHCPTCPPSPNPACPATARTPYSACSLPHARRARLSNY